MSNKPEVIEAVHNAVFPTYNNLQDVIQEAQQELPTMTPNRLRVLFGIYHNTLLAKQKQA